VPDGPAHQPSDEERVQPPPCPGLQDSPRDDAPMRGNHRSPERARDREVRRALPPILRDHRVRVGEALFRPVMQDIHPAFAIGADDAGFARSLPVLRRRCRPLDCLCTQLRLAPAVDLAAQPVDLVVRHRRLPLRRLRWQGRHAARTIALPRPTLRAIRRLRRRPIGDAQRQRFGLAGEVAVARRVVAIGARMQAHRCGPR